MNHFMNGKYPKFLNARPHDSILFLFRNFLHLENLKPLLSPTKKYQKGRFYWAFKVDPGGVYVVKKTQSRIRNEGKNAEKFMTRHQP
jgi:hypothetical protein